ncbi:MAG: hypothetical protein R2827_01220 [Bdellovibrionales bacterium]
MEWLSEKVLGQNIRGENREALPRTYESGGFKTFVGFGERKLKTIDVIDYYLSQNNIELKLSPDEWVNLLLQKYDGEILHKSELTQVLIEDGRIKSIILNETTRLEADKYIFVARLEIC